MNWDNLKTLNCPQCKEDDKDLERNQFNHGLQCLICGFFITESKLRSIVEPMFTRTGDHFGRADFEDLMDAI